MSALLEERAETVPISISQTAKQLKVEFLGEPLPPAFDPKNLQEEMRYIGINGKPRILATNIISHDEQWDMALYEQWVQGDRTDVFPGATTIIFNNRTVTYRRFYRHVLEFPDSPSKVVTKEVDMRSPHYHP